MILYETKAHSVAGLHLSYYLSFDPHSVQIHQLLGNQDSMAALREDGSRVLSLIGVIASRSGQWKPSRVQIILVITLKLPVHMQSSKACGKRMKAGLCVG